MPSFDHDFLAALFHNCSGLAPALLEASAKIVVDHTQAVNRSIDLTQVTPTEYRADGVILLKNPNHRPVAGLVVEIQINRDRRKRFSWPSYVTNLRARYRCRTFLLVLAPDRGVEKWARRPIQTGHPDFSLTPIVIGFGDVPRIQNEADAALMPELAVLSTLAHPELEIAKATIFGINKLPSERKELYMDVILSVLPAPVRQSLEVEMQSYKDYYRSDWVHNFVVKGREEGRKEGLEEGRKEGLEKGREEGLEEGLVKGRRQVARLIAQAKLKKLAQKDVAAIDLVDEQRLDALVTSLAKAQTAADARVILKRLRAQPT